MKKKHTLVDAGSQPRPRGWGLVGGKSRWSTSVVVRFCFVFYCSIIFSWNILSEAEVGLLIGVLVKLLYEFMIII